jgi:hypothetical protein
MSVAARGSDVRDCGAAGPLRTTPHRPALSKRATFAGISGFAGGFAQQVRVITRPACITSHKVSTFSCLNL